MHLLKYKSMDNVQLPEVLFGQSTADLSTTWTLFWDIPWGKDLANNGM